MLPYRDDLISACKKASTISSSVAGPRSIIKRPSLRRWQHGGHCSLLPKRRIQRRLSCLRTRTNLHQFQLASCSRVISPRPSTVTTPLDHKPSQFADDLARQLLSVDEISPLHLLTIGRHPNQSRQRLPVP